MLFSKDKTSCSTASLSSLLLLFPGLDDDDEIVAGSHCQSRLVRARRAWVVMLLFVLAVGVFFALLLLLLLLRMRLHRYVIHAEGLGTASTMANSWHTRSITDSLLLLLLLSHWCLF